MKFRKFEEMSDPEKVNRFEKIYKHAFEVFETEEPDSHLRHLAEMTINWSLNSEPMTFKEFIKEWKTTLNPAEP